MTPREYPPDRIIVCAVQGDWIEWDALTAPGEGDCPFAECDCTPVLYQRTDRSASPTP